MAERARLEAEASAAAEKRKRDEVLAAMAAARDKEDAARRAREAEAAAAAAAAMSAGGGSGGGGGGPVVPTSIIGGLVAEAGGDAHAIAVNKQVADIVASCAAKGTKYSDPWSGPRALAGVKAKGGTWERVRGIGPTVAVVDAGYSAVDICQGSVGDCYLISALSVLAGHPAMMDQILLTKDFNEAGVFGVRMWKAGRWQEIIVDDQFLMSQSSYFSPEDKKVYSGRPNPAKKQYFVPEFAGSRSRNEVWYVKMALCYHWCGSIATPPARASNSMRVQHGAK